MRNRRLTNWTIPIAVALVAALFPTRSSANDGTAGEWLREGMLTEHSEDDFRLHANWVADQAGRPATRLVIYALPNGNTIEQTLGCQRREALDWHYDIQHVAAQIRLLRSLEPDERIVLVCLEANGLSWPNWRRTHEGANATIARLVGTLRKRFGDEKTLVSLTGHSGGGSFIFGSIEGRDTIPDYVDRITFLDSNYSYDASKHHSKFTNWLSADDSRHLVVIAYDDRNILFNGKKVVGPTGGTFRATGRMREAFGGDAPLVTTDVGPFRFDSGFSDRLRMYVHPNPNNKILHTALVGEMNGLLHAETLGTPLEGAWGNFGGPRAYTAWVQPNDTPRPPAPTIDSIPVIPFPARAADAVTGNKFIEQIAGFDAAERERAIAREITLGNVPSFLREAQAIPFGSGETAGTFFTLPDYLAIGSDDDFVRMPMQPQTAQRLADKFDCLLPTTKMVDLIDAAAELRLPPYPMTEQRETPATFHLHHRIIEAQGARWGRGLLTSGIKKDVVITNRLAKRADRLALYGWHYRSGKPIQPLTTVHVNWYVDYSHGVRLVSKTLVLNEKQKSASSVLSDASTCELLSSEGPITTLRYPIAEEAGSGGN